MKRTCPACGKYDNNLIFENRFEVPLNHAFYEGYNVVECACGMIYADEIPSQEEFSAYYRAQSKKSSRFAENKFVEPEWYVNIHKSTANWLDNHLGLAGKTVLDCGCFSGDLMKQMNGYGAICFGYDPSVTGIMISKSLNLNVSQAESFYSSSFYGMKFDLLVLSHVIEHILDHQSFFLDLDDALTENGMIYIEVPDLENFDLSDDPSMMVDQREPMLQFNGEHINFFNKQSLWRMMDRLGYKTLEIDQVTSGICVLAGVFKRKTSGKDDVNRYLDECKHIYEMMDLRLSAYMGHPVYIWGAGGHTQRSLFHTNMKDMKIAAFIDNDKNLSGDTLMGKPIISPAQISEQYPIIISSLLYMEEIAEQIRRMNLKNKVVKLYEG